MSVDPVTVTRPAMISRLLEAKKVALRSIFAMIDVSTMRKSRW